MEDITFLQPGELLSSGSSLGDARIALYSEFMGFMLESMGLKANDSE